MDSLPQTGTEIASWVIAAVAVAVVVAGVIAMIVSRRRRGREVDEEASPATSVDDA